MSEIRNLVGKLNDRKIQESRASGITLYVVLVIIAAIAQQIINSFEIIHNYLSDITSFEVILITWVIVEGLHLVIASFIIKVSFFKDIRIVSYSSKRNTILEEVIKLIQLSIPIVLSTFVLINSFKWFPTFVLVVYVVLFLLYSTNKLLKLFNSGPSSTKISEDSGFSKKKTIRHEIIWFCIGTFFIIYPTIYSFLYDSTLSNSVIVQIVNFTILNFVLLFAVNIALDLYKVSIVDNMLKDLEAQIYLKNLSDDEITKQLHDQFIGISLDDWISKKNEQIQLSYIVNIQLMETIIDNWMPRQPDDRLLDKMMLARDKFTAEITYVHQDIVNIAYRDKHVYTELDDTLVQDFINYLHSKITEFDIHMETRFDSL